MPKEEGDSAEVDAMQAVWIVLLATCAAVLYGVVHDQITARVCIEYFTVFHPPLIRSDSPTVLGLFWGVVATWWVGAGLGVGLAAAARIGSRPRLTWRDLVGAMGLMLLAVGACAAIAGLCGWMFAPDASAWRYAHSTPPGWTNRFYGVWAAHLTSYGGGAIGGVALCVWAWRERRRKP